MLWSGSTAEAKTKLHFDDAPPRGDFTWKRARLNARIKSELINDCLSHPQPTAGESGPALREMMKNALCETVDLSYDSSKGSCRETGAKGGREGPILIVAESLGSKMVIDASFELLAGSSPKAFERKLAFVPQVYMLANQLPLIDLAHASQAPAEVGERSVPPVSDSATRFAKALIENSAFTACSIPASVHCALVRTRSRSSRLRIRTIC